jgi:hypothetical protein
VAPALSAPTRRAKLAELQAAVSAAQAKGDRIAEAKALKAAGYFYYAVSDYQRALDCFNQGAADRSRGG